MTMAIHEIVDFNENEVIGRGQYGVVYWKMIDEARVAIKRIPNDIEERESEIQRNICNEHIIEIFKSVIEDPFKYLIMEYMDGGNLYNLVHQSKETYDFNDVKNWFVQIAKALHYLHNNTRIIIHRDVKPQNMLLDKSRKTIKLCDLGSSRYHNTKMTGKKGTGIYMAPEMFKDSALYNTSVDIYSLSISLAETLTREIPYTQLKEDDPNLSELLFIKKIVDRNLRPDISKFVVKSPDSVKSLIIESWNRDQNVRPTAQVFIDKLSKMS